MLCVKTTQQLLWRWQWRWRSPPVRWGLVSRHPSDACDEVSFLMNELCWLYAQVQLHTGSLWPVTLCKLMTLSTFLVVFFFLGGPSSELRLLHFVSLWLISSCLSFRTSPLWFLAALHCFFLFLHYLIWCLRLLHHFCTNIQEKLTTKKRQLCLTQWIRLFFFLASMLLPAARREKLHSCSGQK